jgi:hypothetical protein
MWAWAALAVIPVWVILAVVLLNADRRPPDVVQVAAAPRLNLSGEYRRTVVDDYSLYVSPGAAAKTTTCQEPRDVGDLPITRTAPDRSGTADRTVDGVKYSYYGRVYQGTRAIECSPGVTGLLLTEYDGNHQKRYFAVALLVVGPVIGLIGIRILRRRP